MAEAPGLGKQAAVTLDAEAFEAGFNEALVHECVRAELNARRQGTASTRTRGLVRGGGVKPWRQKGTGRARAGSIRSPLWAGGGTVFGPSPRHYTFKVNRKARRVALRSALSLHAGRGSIAVLDPGAWDAPATKLAARTLTEWGADGPVLVVLADEEAPAAKSFRNMASVSVLPPQAVGVADLVAAASLLVSPAALEALTGRARGDRATAASADGGEA
jgi:large subunit ribosomal protein L4